jgi:hypothetical protein
MTKNVIVINAIVVILIASIVVLTNSKLIQAENIEGIEILNLNVEPTTINAGDTFSINGSISNNSTNTISVHNECAGPFLVIFDDHATVTMEKVCNWMPIQIILKPGESRDVTTSIGSNLVYNADSSGIVNGNVTVSYDVINESNPDLSNIDNTISKSISFTINDKNNQANGGHPTILSPLKQFKSGINAKNIQCNEGLELVIKKHNNSPACVKSTTVEKLVSLGWVKSPQSNVSEEESSTKDITLEDSGKSITLKTGQSFLLKLGEDFEWNVEVDNQDVVSRALNIMVIRGAQGVYEAHVPGHAILTAVGDPPCLHSEPPCRMHSILFTLDIEVT